MSCDFVTRFPAIITVLRDNITDKCVLNELNKISSNVQKEPKVIGEWTTGHIALAVLYQLDTEDAQKIYADNVKKFGLDEKNFEKVVDQIAYLIN